MELIPAELFLIRDGPLGGASGCVDGGAEPCGKRMLLQMGFIWSQAGGTF